LRVEQSVDAQLNGLHQNTPKTPSLRRGLSYGFNTSVVTLLAGNGAPRQCCSRLLENAKILGIAEILAQRKSAMTVQPNSKGTPETFAREGLGAAYYRMPIIPFSVAFVGSFVLCVEVFRLTESAAWLAAACVAAAVVSVRLFFGARRRGASVHQALGTAFFGAPYLYVLTQRANRA
jgi:hypothetical protein